MDEPEEQPRETNVRRWPLPAVLLGLTAAYLAMILYAAWWCCDGTVDQALLLRFHAVWLGTLALVILVTLAGASAGPTAVREPEAWLCPHCLKPYVPGALFCPRCSAPQTFFAATGKYERVHASAWIVGKAARHPSRPLHLIGLGMLGGPFVLGLICLMVNVVLSLPDGPTGEAVDAGALGAFSLMGLLWGALFLIGLRNWRRRARGLAPAQREIEYGAPPWFSYDTAWALPEFEEAPDGGASGATPEAAPGAG